VRHMTGTDGLAAAPGTVAERPDVLGTVSTELHAL
jgi:hypothetical protein